MVSIPLVVFWNLLGIEILLATTEPQARPNILLIYADDLGWKDPSYQGHPQHETPHLDRLAAGGMIFHAGYAGAGNCAPSRACLLSGSYTPRHRVFYVGANNRGSQRSQRLIAMPGRSGLPAEVRTVAEVLRDAGYATGIFGKWHLAGPDGENAGNQGFEVVVDPRAHSPNRFRDEPQDPKGAFTITREALEFMDRSKAAGKPFFAFVSHHAIHAALEARPATLNRFRKVCDDPGAALYAACLADLDASVGLLLEGLGQRGLAGDTLVVFSSDNGATKESPQEPLRGNKGGYYEGGIRVPMLVRWPGRTRSGSICRVPVHQVDLFPTFLAAAGIPVPAGIPLDGVDLSGLLAGADPAPRALFWHFPGYLDGPVLRGRPGDVALGFRTRPVSVIRKGDWKLHLFHEEWVLDGGAAGLPASGAVELYHLGKDEGEHRDLAAEEPAKRDELLRDLLRWMEAVEAPLPEARNPAYRTPPR